MTQDPIAWLYGLQHFGIKLGLDSVRVLLGALGSPESAYPSVLVGGTNGKGSVSAMLAALLDAAGIRTGLYTSPHLVRPTERIRIGGSDIAAGELDRRLETVRSTIESARAAGTLTAHPSFFEVLTAVALRAFADHRVGVAVLEVGLGGRLDATNAVDADLAVVVGVDLDHTAVLGDTIERIAAEKAGIVKHGKPVVSGVVRQTAVSVLQRVCAERQAALVDGRTAARLTDECASRFSLRGRRADYPDLELPIEGRHQIDNARIAVAAFEILAERLGVAPDPDAVRRGLAAVRWPGRLQWVEARGGWPRLLLDGAHNEAGMRALAAHLDRRAIRPAAIVFGATEGRPARALLEPLAARTDRVVVTQPPVDKAQTAGSIAAVAREMFPEVEVAETPREALSRAAAGTAEEGFVLVTGSLYLVGSVLGMLSSDEAPGPVSM